MNVNIKTSIMALAIATLGTASAVYADSYQADSYRGDSYKEQRAVKTTGHATTMSRSVQTVTEPGIVEENVRLTRKRVPLETAPIVDEKIRRHE